MSYQQTKPKLMVELGCLQCHSLQTRRPGNYKIRFEPCIVPVEKNDSVFTQNPLFLYEYALLLGKIFLLMEYADILCKNPSPNFQSEHPIDFNLRMQFKERFNKCTHFNWIGTA